MARIGFIEKEEGLGMSAPIVWFVLAVVFGVLAVITAFTVGWFAPVLFGVLAIASAALGFVLRARSRS